jgi:cell division control protein 45
MILDSDHWHNGYQQILKDCRSADSDGTAGSALILCNADVDAMAAARILSYALRSDGVSHQIQPCMAYSQLVNIIQQQQQQQSSSSSSLRAIVLLNLGATRNLTRLFDEHTLLDAQSVKIYVMDCRRPVHLANFHAESHVVIFYDDINHDDIPSDGDNLSGNESSTDEEDDDDDDDDEEDSEDEEESDLDEGEQEFEMQNDKLPEANADDASADYDGEDESENNGSASKRRRRTTDKDGGDDESNKDVDDDATAAADDDAVASDSDEMKDSTVGEAFAKNLEASSSQQQQQPTMTPRELYQERRRRLRSYYSHGTFFASPASFVAYHISTQLRFKDVGDLLWLASVGVTDAYLQARLDVAAYAHFAVRLKKECNRIFPENDDPFYHRVGNAVYAEHLLGNNNTTTNNESNAAQGQQQQRTRIGFSGNGRVFSQDDFRFFLLRHTSLWEAMMYSDFVSTRLQLTTKQGVQKLQEFLAKMGYPLEECHQPFAFMKPKFRRRLQSQILAHAEEYGLENFGFTSFFRVTGYQSLLSASDTSHAITALLESETANSNISSNGNMSAEQQEEEALMRSFNIAYDALNSNGSSSSCLSAVNALTTTLGESAAGGGNNLMNLVSGGSLAGHSTGIGAGIRLAMMLQKNIMATAASLMDRHAITRLSHFRYAYITCTNNSVGGNQGAENNQPRGNKKGKDGSKEQQQQQQQHIFAKPLALSRLAHYLMDLHRENGKWTGAKSRPLVLIAEKPLTQTYLVVGFEYPESAGSAVKNRFGPKFELAAQSIKGSFRFDSFDSNVVEVASNDAQRFIEQLHYLMDSA